MYLSVCLLHVCSIVCTGEPDHGEATDEEESPTVKLKPVQEKHHAPQSVSVEVLVRVFIMLLPQYIDSPSLPPSLSSAPPSLPSATDGSLEQNGGLPQPGTPLLPHPPHRSSRYMYELLLDRLSDVPLADNPNILIRAHGIEQFHLHTDSSLHSQYVIIHCHYEIIFKLKYTQLSACIYK